MNQATIVVLIEHEHGHVTKASRELISGAAALAETSGAAVTVLLTGPDAASAAQTLKTAPVDRILIEQNHTASFLEQRRAALFTCLSACKPFALLMAQTALNRDVAGCIGARLRAALLTDAQAIHYSDGQFFATASKLGGSVITRCTHRAYDNVVLLVRANAFVMSNAEGTPSLEQQASAFDERVRTVLTAPIDVAAEVALEEAEVIVSGGRGMGGPEPFTGMLAELAAELGGSVGASRAAVDAGWVAHTRQIGQTGKTVRPRLYLAAGISGAIQHRVGMQTAGTIIALTKDAQPPIADYADLVVVGDAFHIIPALTRLLKEEKGHS